MSKENIVDTNDLVMISFIDNTEETREKAIIWRADNNTTLF